MDSYTLQRLILSCQGLKWSDKLVGMTMALFLSVKKQKIIISQKVLAEKCSISERSVREAIKRLIENGFFERQRTVRVDEFVTGKNTCIREAESRAGSKRHHVPVAKKSPRKKMPWNYDLEYSTLSEERGKREDEMLGLNQFCQEQK